MIFEPSPGIIMTIEFKIAPNNKDIFKTKVYVNFSKKIVGQPYQVKWGWSVDFNKNGWDYNILCTYFLIASGFCLWCVLILSLTWTIL